jgi:hypothetical protein
MGGRRNQKNQEINRGQGAQKTRARQQVPNLNLGKNAMQGEFSSPLAMNSARKSNSRREDLRSGGNTGRRRTSFERQASHTSNVISPNQERDGHSLGKKGTLYPVQENEGTFSPYTAIPASGERSIRDCGAFSQQLV